MADLKQVACSAIDNQAEDLSILSKEIWDHPELNLNEVYSHDYLTKFLEDRGFPVDRKYKHETAFRAVLGDHSSGPHVAVLCEYDALPEIGHACGHNLIAEVGVAAGIGIKAAFEKAGKPLGKVSAVLYMYTQMCASLHALRRSFFWGGVLCACKCYPIGSVLFSKSLLTQGGYLNRHNVTKIPFK